MNENVLEILLQAYSVLTILIIILAIIFRKRNKGPLWIITVLYLIFCGTLSKVIASINMFGLDETAVVKGVNFPELPLFIGLILLLLAFPLILLHSKYTLPYSDSASSKRWLWLGLGTSLPLLSMLLFLMSIFSPSIYFAETPVPNIGVIIYLISTPIAVLVLYSVSKFTSIQKPNQMKWLVLIITILVSTLPLVSIMILLYIMPLEDGGTYPFLAGLMTINYIYFSFLMIKIAKDYIPKTNTEKKEHI